MLRSEFLLRLIALLVIAVLGFVGFRSIRRNREGERQVRAAEGGDKAAERWLETWLKHETRRPLWAAVGLDLAVLVAKITVFIGAVGTLLQPSWVSGAR